MNKYRIANNKTIGEGGFGKTKLVCLKSDSNEQYIMKIMKYDQFAEKESQILKSINHGFVVKYIDSFRNGSDFHIVMEYARGGDLRQLIRKQNGQPFKEYYIFEIFEQICYAIDYIHSKNILHRDLKPENIFLRDPLIEFDDIFIKIGDFGISKQLVYNNGYAKTRCGTYRYMAPEVLDGLPYGKKADIYGLGCILFELLTLRKYEYPEDPSKSSLPSEYKVDNGTRPYIHNSTWRYLKKMLSKDPENRPSAEWIIECLKI